MTTETRLAADGVLADLSPAPYLRLAAAVMRSRATAATPGPWDHICLGSDGCAVVRTEGTPRERMRGRVAKSGWKDWHDDHADALHLAGMSPPVALAMAVLLDAAATDVETYDDESVSPAVYLDYYAEVRAIADGYLTGDRYSEAVRLHLADPETSKEADR